MCWIPFGNNISTTLIVAQSVGHGGLVSRITSPYGAYKTCKPMAAFPCWNRLLVRNQTVTRYKWILRLVPPHLPVTSQALIFPPRFLIFCAQCSMVHPSLLLMAGLSSLPVIWITPLLVLKVGAHWLSRFPRSLILDIIEEICENISQDSAIGSNTGQGPTTDQSSSAQEANAQEPCKPQVDPTPLSHSADNFETSVHASGQVPEYGSYLMPTPSITSEVKSCQTVGVSRRNAKRIAKPNVDLHAALPFPTPSHFSNPQYGMSQNVLIHFFVAYLTI